MNRSLYFAYGSNLNASDLARWAREKGLGIPRLERVCLAFLPDQTLVFPRYSKRREGGVLGYVESLGSVVEGVVFSVESELDWQLLDQKEDAGKSGAYSRVQVDVIDQSGKLLKVWTYRANVDQPRKHYQPSDAYLEVVKRGLTEHGLGTDAVEAAATEAQLRIVNGFFFYGTLMRGESRFDCLKAFGITCCLLADTNAVLVDLGAYPGMLPATASDQAVHGEFVRLTDANAALQALDEIEGFRGYGKSGSLYQRTLICVHVGDHRFRQAWAYQVAKPAPDQPRIPSGDWREHRGVREKFLLSLAKLHLETPKKAGQAGAPGLGLGGQDAQSNANPDSLDPQVVSQRLMSRRISERSLVRRSGTWTAGC
jgi:gamma-glutamylcyclotransferase (GGCT)/AIG2-like uncharacterized protein YtfP